MTWLCHWKEVSIVVLPFLSEWRSLNTWKLLAHFTTHMKCWIGAGGFQTGFTSIFKNWWSIPVCIHLNELLCMSMDVCFCPFITIMPIKVIIIISVCTDMVLVWYLEFKQSLQKRIKARYCNFLQLQSWPRLKTCFCIQTVLAPPTNQFMCPK